MLSKFTQQSLDDVTLKYGNGGTWLSGEPLEKGAVIFLTNPRHSNHAISPLENLGLTVITYEDFLDYRKIFFREVCSFLKVSYALPDKTDYSVMISDLQNTVTNYEELVAKVQSMELGHML